LGCRLGHEKIACGVNFADGRSLWAMGAVSDKLSVGWAKDVAAPTRMLEDRLGRRLSQRKIAWALAQLTE